MKGNVLGTDLFSCSFDVYSCCPPRLLIKWSQLRERVCVCACVCVQPFTSDQSAETCRQKHSLPPLPIWSKGSRVATALEMTLTNVCVCEDVFLCACCARCPSCSSSLGCGSLWLDLWPGHLTFPVPTAPRSPSCEIDSVCASTSVLSLHPGGAPLTLSEKSPINTFVCFLTVWVPTWFPLIVALFDPTWNLLCEISLSLHFLSFVPRFLAPSAEEERNCIPAQTDTISTYVFGKNETGKTHCNCEKYINQLHLNHNWLISN